ncbi:MAG: hypothetical protein ACK4VI_03085 [Alphaproteobacteria bacterium]
MASFDIMHATRQGYFHFWAGRHVLVRLAMIPLFLKIISYFVVLSLGLEGNILRQGLILLPATLLEGYMVCLFLRLATFSHEPMEKPYGSAAEVYYKIRARDIQAGAVIYTLLKLFSTFVVGIIMGMGEPSEEFQTSFLAFLLIIGLLVGMIWAVRIAWIYIPVVLGYSVKEYLHRVRGFSFSFHALSVWIMCLLPPLLATIVLSDILGLITGHTAESPSQIFRYMIVMFQSVIELAIVIISTVAVGNGIYQLMSGQADKSDKA